MHNDGKLLSLQIIMKDEFHKSEADIAYWPDHQGRVRDYLRIKEAEGVPSERKMLNWLNGMT